MNGKDKTFYNLEPIVLKGLDKLNDRDATHLMYAYSVRNVGNPELHKAFENKLGKIAGDLDYPSLFNAIYYMLFRENANENIWKKLVEATLKQKDVLPLLYYRPFKASKFFLKHKFPKMDISDYTDKFWYAERYWSTFKQEDYLYSDQKYFNFKGFLNQHCLVYPIVFMTVHNMFLLHYVFNDQKIAINYHLNNFVIPDHDKASAMQQLPAKILKLEGWEILDLTEKEFNNWTYQERVDNIKGWLRAAKAKQVEKGIMEAQPREYV